MVERKSVANFVNISAFVHGRKTLILEQYRSTIFKLPSPPHKQLLLAAKFHRLLFPHQTHPNSLDNMTNYTQRDFLNLLHISVSHLRLRIPAVVCILSERKMKNSSRSLTQKGRLERSVLKMCLRLLCNILKLQLQ